jgi:hypothetical protein
VARKAVDVLFVVDTSASMDPKRARIAERIPDFVRGLAPDTDYRIGVMLAHGGASYDSGRLYSLPGLPRVLDPKALGIDDLQHDLSLILGNVDDDVDEANGEAGMYSLLRSLQPERLAEIRRQGFYRAEAALAVVFVTDENDICFPPELNGYTTFPDYVPSAGGIERVAYERYCRAPGETAANEPDRVYARLVALQDTLPLTLGGIIHVDPARVPQGPGLEDAIGHGILELTRKSANGVLIDIEDSSFADGLSHLGSVVQTTLELRTRFGLDEAVAAGSIQVSVDGGTVPFLYDDPSRTVEIPLASAGHAGSVVDVGACIGAGGLLKR